MTYTIAQSFPNYNLQSNLLVLYIHHHHHHHCFQEDSCLNIWWTWQSGSTLSLMKIWGTQTQPHTCISNFLHIYTQTQFLNYLDFTLYYWSCHETLWLFILFMKCIITFVVCMFTLKFTNWTSCINSSINFTEGCWGMRNKGICIFISNLGHNQCKSVVIN